jgi:hypothetical protein
MDHYEVLISIYAISIFPDVVFQGAEDERDSEDEPCAEDERDYLK